MGAPAKKYLQILSKIPSEKNVDLYLVGGSVRDHLLRKDCADFDFTAKNIHDLANRFSSETKSPCISLDATPGRNTLRVIVQKQFHFDFTDMQGNSIEEDLAQRDFSINAMAIQLNDYLDGRETLIDPHKGQADLHNKIIRVIPGPIFASDPLRLLRAFRFASSLEF
jgi:tRNA nucleotidyltransferase/poly(A) polymerase